MVQNSTIYSLWTCLHEKYNLILLYTMWTVKNSSITPQCDSISVIEESQISQYFTIESGENEGV